VKFIESISWSEENEIHLWQSHEKLIKCHFSRWQISKDVSNNVSSDLFWAVLFINKFLRLNVKLSVCIFTVRWIDTQLTYLSKHTDLWNEIKYHLLLPAGHQQWQLSDQQNTHLFVLRRHPGQTTLEIILGSNKSTGCKDGPDGKPALVQWTCHSVLLERLIYRLNWLRK